MVDSIYLRKFSWFRTLSEEDLQQIFSYMQISKFALHSHVFFQGDAVTSVYFVSKGKVRIYKNDANGKEQLVSILKEGDMFPHVGIFNDKREYPANARSDQDGTELLSLNINSLKSLLMKYPTITLNLVSSMEDKVFDLQVRLAEQVFYTAFEKIVNQLIRLAHHHGRGDADGWVSINYILTNTDLANMVGTTRETVNRTLNKLKNDGLISFSSEGLISIKLEQLLNSEEHFLY